MSKAVGSVDDLADMLVTYSVVISERVESSLPYRTTIRTRTTACIQIVLRHSHTHMHIHANRSMRLQMLQADAGSVKGGLTRRVDL